LITGAIGLALVFFVGQSIYFMFVVEREDIGEDYDRGLNLINVVDSWNYAQRMYTTDSSNVHLYVGGIISVVALTLVASAFVMPCWIHKCIRKRHEYR
jgi:hypothetical protein